MWGLSHPKRRKIEERDLAGFKYFKKITRLLERLHDAGNRRLHVAQAIAAARRGLRAWHQRSPSLTPVSP